MSHWLNSVFLNLDLQIEPVVEQMKLDNCERPRVDKEVLAAVNEDHG